MKKIIKEILNKPLGVLGFEVSKKIKKIDLTPEKFVDIDSDNFFKEIYPKCSPYTMTGKEKMYAMYQATEYIIKNDIPGDIVECGPWRGGSLMVAALTLLNSNHSDRYIYGYDTYEGMTMPEKVDTNVNNLNAIDYFNEIKEKSDKPSWCYSSLEETKSNLLSTNYPENKILLVKGKVEETIPKIIPNKISLLRLDTDWYASTLHELIYLFPLLSKGGVIIIDDYGHWEGQKKAVDEYFKKNNINLLLNRTDYSGRVAIKN